MRKFLGSTALALSLVAAPAVVVFAQEGGRGGRDVSNDAGGTKGGATVSNVVGTGPKNSAPIAAEALEAVSPASGGAASHMSVTPISTAAASPSASSSAPASEPHAKNTALTAAQLKYYVSYTVFNRKGEVLGTLTRVVTGLNGKATHLVIQHGGFIGLFQTDTEVPVSAVQPTIDNGELQLATTENELGHFPNYTQH